MALSPPFCVSNCWRTSGGNAIFSLLVLDFEPSVMSRWLATVAALLESHINTALKPRFFSSWRTANLKSFIAQSHQRIDFCGASRRQPAGEQPHESEQQRCGKIRREVGRFDLEQQPGHQLRDPKRAR